MACSHLIGAVWALRLVVGNATLTPPQEGPNSPLFALVSHPWFNSGSFGVGLFFLISGLVIPISLERHTPGSFLLARALRIYPTYAAALLVEMAVLYLNARHWGHPFGYGAWAIMSNILLIHDLVGQPYVDLVNWTLCVELRFYLIMALVAGAVRRGSVVVLVATALAALGINLALRAGALGPPVSDPALLSYALSTESMFIVFMLIGVLFNYHLRDHLGTVALVLWIGVLGAIFALCWRESVLDTLFPTVTWNYAYALAVFAALYALRRRVPDSRALDALAAISFPFYLVHSLVGYSVLKWLMLSLGWGYPAALTGAVAVVVLVATGLHRVVEAPPLSMGRRLTPSRQRSPAMRLPATATEQ